MKKILLFAFFIFLGNILLAQPWVRHEKNGKVKFCDAISLHKSMMGNNREEADNKVIGNNPAESNDHLFEKWEWYWSQHLDTNGYIVPSAENVRQWEKYTASHKAQRNERTTSGVYPSNWQFQGPSTTSCGYAGIGRLNVVAFDPVDSTTLYVGSPAGSTWKTTDGGATWTSLYNNLPSIGVADIKVNPLNRNTVYVATGDNDNWDTYSTGVIVSYNGGLTWNTSGLTWAITDWHHCKSMLINPVDTNTILVATDNGIYKTHAATGVWTLVAPGNFSQLVYNPTDTTIIYASENTSVSAQIVRSTDGGNTWTTMTTFTATQRISLAVCRTAPNVVMALASNSNSGLQGIYNSSDYGATYNSVFLNDTTCVNNLLTWDMGLPSTACNGQGWYDLCIAVKPTDVNQITIGGVNTYYSNDGGYTWQLANTWYETSLGLTAVHADKHCLAYNPISGALFETCDGGIYKNYGLPTDAWYCLSSGICVTEFYKNAVDNGANFVLGGAQDNGSKMTDGVTSTDLTGGDGTQPMFNYKDPTNVFYTSYIYGNVQITRDGGATFYGITDVIGDAGAWVTPFAMHPTDTSTIFIGYKNVYATYNSGISWSAISPVFDSANDLAVLKIAPSNPNYIYVTKNSYATWSTNIYYTTDAGITWDSIIVPFPGYIFVNDLAIDPTNEKHFWVVMSGYAVTNKVESYDLTTGLWTNETGTLPNMPVTCMLIDTSTLTKYIGTGAAVFYKQTGATDWTLYNTNLPAVSISDLQMNYTTKELWASTYGRGMWKSTGVDYPVKIRQTVANSLDLKFFPNPNQGSFTISGNDKIWGNNDVSIKVISVDGKIVSFSKATFNSGGNININLQGVAPGYYLCELKSNLGNYRQSIIIY